jgi:GNAT superfamily N-acetyltransferase
MSQSALGNCDAGAAGAGRAQERPLVDRLVDGTPPAKGSSPGLTRPSTLIRRAQRQELHHDRIPTGARLRAMNVRDATPQDAREIAALLGALGYPTEARQVERRLGVVGDSDAVLITSGGLIALHRIPLLAEGGALARITALVVAPDRRSQGIGRALLAAAEAVAEHWGCDLIEVSCGRRAERAAAHALYQSAGFTDTALSSVRYWKQLNGSSPAANGSPDSGD